MSFAQSWITCLKDIPGEQTKRKAGQEALLNTHYALSEAGVKIATFNVNGVNGRLPVILR